MIRGSKYFIQTNHSWFALAVAAELGQTPVEEFEVTVLIDNQPHKARLFWETIAGASELVIEFYSTVLATVNAAQGFFDLLEARQNQTPVTPADVRRLLLLEGFIDVTPKFPLITGGDVAHRVAAPNLSSAPADEAAGREVAAFYADILQ